MLCASPNGVRGNLTPARVSIDKTVSKCCIIVHDILNPLSRPHWAFLGDPQRDIQPHVHATAAVPCWCGNQVCSTCCPFRQFVPLMACAFQNLHTSTQPASGPPQNYHSNLASDTFRPTTTSNAISMQQCKETRVSDACIARTSSRSPFRCPAMMPLENRQ